MPTSSLLTRSEFNNRFLFRMQVLYGQSMGGALAIDLASRHPQEVPSKPCVFRLLDSLTLGAGDCLDRRKHFHVTGRCLGSLLPCGSSA